LSALDAALAPGALIPTLAKRAWPPRKGLPCCSLVSMVILAVNDRIPSEASSGGAMLGPWRRAAPAGWWDMANLAREEWQPWDALLAARHFYGASELRIQETGRHPLPCLTPGRWHVVQWWSLDLSYGHTQLYHRAPDGEFPYYQGTHLRKVHSSKAKGYRDHGASRWPWRDRMLCGVATLPEGA